MKHIFTLIMCINFIKNVLSSGSVAYTSILRNTIILNTEMPTLYLENELKLDKNIYRSIYSMEHILPRSYLEKSHHNDMHNIIKTINEINVLRSNYKYADEKMINSTTQTDWINIQHDNKVNHKKRLFVPNNYSRGFISRALLYMSHEYEYPLKKIIDGESLKSWFYKYPPTKHEIYHNKIVSDIQKKDNIFISKYNKKCKKIHQYLLEICDK